MPFRPRLPLRLLLPHLRHHATLAPAPPRRPLSYSPAAESAAAAATESDEDAVVAGDAPLAPPRAGGAGGAAPGPGWEREGAVGGDRVELERKDASIAARFALCHELLWQRRWREMRGGLAQMVSEQGSDSAPALCDILWNEFREWNLNSTVWDALANSYARAQMIRDALYVLRKMNSLNMQISVSTYDSLLYSLRKTDMALVLFEDMESWGVFPSDYSHSILIDGLCKQDKIGEALSFLQKAREGGTFKPLGMTFNVLHCVIGVYSGCKITFLSVAEVWIKSGQVYLFNPCMPM